MSELAMNEQLIKKIKILFIIDKLVSAGTQNNLLEIVRHLDMNTFEASIVTLSKGDPMVADFRSAGAKVYEWPVERIYLPAGMAALGKLVGLIKREKFQIVQTHFLIPEILVWLARKIVRIPKVITVRRDEGFWVSRRQRFLSNVCLKSVDFILANSEAVKTACLRNETTLQPVYVIYNGVDLAKYQAVDSERKYVREHFGIAKDETVVGIVANMRHEIKGYSHLIHAIPAIVKKYPKTKFLFVGDGELRANYEKLASDLGVRSNIVFTGTQRDIPKMINAIDICCLTSLTEGFSNSILEYMAMSKSVVATNVGGNSEIIEDGKTGFLIPPGDYHAISEKLILLLQNHKLREAMGRAGRLKVEQQVSLDRMGREYCDFYASMLMDASWLGQSGDQKKVLYVIWSLDLGGAEQVVMNLAKHLDRRKFMPVICCLNEKGRFAPEIEKRGIKVIALNKRPKIDLFIIPKLIRVIKSEKIDVVHTHLFTSNLWGRIAAFFARVPVVSTEHNVDSWKKPYHFLIDSLLTKVNRKIIFVSKEVKKYYEQKIGRLDTKAEILYNGIELDGLNEKFTRGEILQEFEIDRRATVIGIVGRLVAQKGHGTFIKIIADLRQRNINVVGLVVGDGEIKSELMKMCDGLDLRKEMVFTGFRKDVSRLYRGMDVLVMPSTREGFPMTLLEAMAAGVPVVAADVGGVRECIRNGEDGFLVESTNPMDFSDRVVTLLENKSLREKMIAEARKKVATEFSAGMMARRHEDLYFNILNER